MNSDTYFGERILATYRPRALASTPYWRLAALVLGASAVSAALFSWVLASVLGTPITGTLLYAGWAGVTSVACWQGPKIWLEGVRYHLTARHVVVRRGLFQRSIERSAINYSRIRWDRRKPMFGSLELVRAVPTGPLRRKLTLVLSGLEAPDRVLAQIRGAEAPAPAGVGSRPLAQRLDVGERVLWSARRHATWRDFIPDGQRQWMTASLGLALVVLATVLLAQTTGLSVSLLAAGLEGEWVAVVVAATSASVITLLAIASYLIYDAVIAPGLVSRDTRYLVTTSRILVQRGQEETYVDRVQVVDAVEGKHHGHASDLVLVFTGLKQSLKTMARKLEATDPLTPVLRAVDDVEGLMHALSLTPVEA